jgi:protein-L-isoaspartate(D-aspartate) O-methyltransferase
MRLAPRHEFVAQQQRHLAYFDMALPIGDAQTISGPLVVASMTEALRPRPTDRVLEIGTGSGYQAAVLAPLVGMVYSIEIKEALAARAARTLKRLGYRNVVTRAGDGFRGWPEQAPFDGIIVTCSPENVPQPLIDQLAEGGRMVIPVGERFEQQLVRITKRDGVLVRDPLAATLFVPMTGTAEDSRRVLPDGGRPTLRNGGFEEVLEGTAQPVAWYYGRQMEIVTDGSAASGQRHLRLANEIPGRPAQVFQGFGVDGSVVERFTVRCMLRATDAAAGRTADELPALAVEFFDDRRSRSTRVKVGSWKGSFAWRQVEEAVRVPAWAREAILTVGLMGGTGTLDVDEITLQADAK